MIVYVLYDDVGGGGLDPTVVVSGRHEHVPVVPPHVGPAVLDEPVLVSVQNAEPDRQHRVVQLLHAVLTEHKTSS